MAGTRCITKAYFEKHFNKNKYHLTLFESYNDSPSIIANAKKNKLEDFDIVLGTRTSNEAIIISKYLNNKGTIFISTMASHPDVTRLNNKTIRILSNASRYAEHLATHIKDNKYKKLAIVVNESLLYSTFYSNEVINKIKDSGIKYKIFTRIMGEANYDKTVKQVKAYSPDLTYMPLYTLETLNLIQSFSKFFKQANILSNGGITESKGMLINLSRENPDLRLTFNSIWNGKPSGANSQDYINLYNEECITHQSDVKTAAAYDSILLIHKTLSKMSHFNTKTFLNLLKNQKFNGVTGKFRYKDNGEPIRKTFLERIQKGLSGQLQ